MSHPPSPPIDPQLQALSPFRRDLNALASAPFDLLVIGGGSIGTATARDAALRGLSVALIEAEDFGSGTVSRSTRLIHGGLRYLELYDFKLVREALREREILLKTASHLVNPLPFLTPIYRGDRWSPLMVGMGMILYDLLSFDKSLPNHRILSRQEVMREEPGLREDGLLGGALYYDAQVPSPERWCLAQARSAADAGAVCANHLQAVRLLKSEGRVEGVEAEDRLTGSRMEIRARFVVNATGPWAGELAPSPKGRPRLRRTQGAHLVVPPMTRHAIVLLAKEDGRVYFLVPWNGRTMIGTTDLDFDGDPNDAVASGEEVEYLIEETRHVFPQADLSHVEIGFAGVRPLLPSAAENESQVSREHRIFDHAEEGVTGLFSVFGGKLTTARRIAEEIVDKIAPSLGVDTPCRTADLPLRGSPTIGKFRHSHTDKPLSDDGLMGYGTEADAVRRLSKEIEQLNEPFDINSLKKKNGVEGVLPEENTLSSLLKARLLFGLKEEMALTTADLLLRRTLIGYEREDAREIGETVSRWLGNQLNFSEARLQEDHEDYNQQLDRLRIHGIKGTEN